MLDAPRVVLLMSSSAGYDRGILRGIARYIQHHGPWVVFLSGDQRGLPSPPMESVTNQSAMSRNKSKGPRIRRVGSSFNLRALNASGVIGRLCPPEVAEAVLASGLPAVAMDLTDEQLSEKSPLRNISELRPDAHKIGGMAAEHLLDRGYRRFGFCGYPNENWSRWRGEGFVERLKEAGHECKVYQPPGHKIHPAWNQEQRAVTAWLQALRKPAGVMATNDVRGRQVVEACAIGGIHVPDDIAVIGADEDHVLSSLSNPPLSSVALNAEQGGYRAAELLHGMMSGRVKEKQLILVEPLWTVARLSTNIIAIEDREVAGAVMFIRDNARRPIGVRNVVKHSAMSRRALEIRFQQSLGRSIREEIQRVRLAWVKQLLVETDLPIAKIADCTGFSSPSYLCDVFRRETGTTAAAYRRSNLPS
jgi:LacI family transcriptional regulator